MASRTRVAQLANRLRPVGHGAKEPPLATPSALRQCHRDRLLARVESHVGRILLHGSSPMPEALIGITRSTLDAGMLRDEPLAPPDMGSHGSGIHRDGEQQCGARSTARSTGAKARGFRAI